jgi:hypothetical protein
VSLLLYLLPHLLYLLYLYHLLLFGAWIFPAFVLLTGRHFLSVGVAFRVGGRPLQGLPLLFESVTVVEQLQFNIHFLGDKSSYLKFNLSMH